MNNKEEHKESIIQQKSFAFALNIIKLYKELTVQKDNIILKQLLRSATSIGANVQEGSAGQTKRDFITKMAIASKEARETKYWLRLLSESNYFKYDFTSYLSESDDLIRILTKIVKTSQENLKAKT